MNSLYWYNIDVDPLKEKNAIKFKSKTKDEITLRAVTQEKGEVLAVDYVRDYPFDYDGWCLTPVTLFVHNNIYREQFEYKICGGKITYNDGRSRYVRMFVRRKPEFVGQKFS